MAGDDLDVHPVRRTLPKLAQELCRNARVDLVEGDRCGAGPFQPLHDDTREPCQQRNLPALERVSSVFMPTFKAVTVSVPSVEASAGVEAPGEDIEGTRWRTRGGTFLHYVRAHLNQNAALLLRLLLQLLLGVEAPTRQLP